METKAFATVEELEGRFRALSDDEKKKAAAILEDAAVLICSELKNADLKIDPEDEMQAAALRIVSCSIARRALSNGSGDSITQASRTAGPFSQQVTYANPTADLYLTKQDRNILGINQSGEGFSFIRPKICRGVDDA